MNLFDIKLIDKMVIVSEEIRRKIRKESAVELSKFREEAKFGIAGSQPFEEVHREGTRRDVGLRRKKWRARHQTLEY